MMKSHRAISNSTIALVLVAFAAAACSDSPVSPADPDRPDPLFLAPRDGGTIANPYTPVMRVINPRTGMAVDEVAFCDNAPPVVLRIQMSNLTDFRANWATIGASPTWTTAPGVHVSTLAVLPDNFRNPSGIPYGPITVTKSQMYWSGYLDFTINGSASSAPQGEHIFALTEVAVDDQNPGAGFTSVKDATSVHTEPVVFSRYGDCDYHLIYHR